MHASRRFVAGLIWVTLAMSHMLLTIATAATPVHKCIVNGTVTFQQDPCPTGQPRRMPSVEQLNLEERKRRESAAAATPSASRSVPREAEAAAKDDGPARSTERPAASSSGRGFKCDGREYCSQMTSCEEAKYFLKNCPGAKMDGNNNGVPCEQQWCKGWQGFR
jgi:hypothetical protein